MILELFFDCVYNFMSFLFGQFLWPQNWLFRTICFFFFFRNPEHITTHNRKIWFISEMGPSLAFRALSSTLVVYFIKLAVVSTCPYILSTATSCSPKTWTALKRTLNDVRDSGIFHHFMWVWCFTLCINFLQLKFFKSILKLDFIYQSRLKFWTKQSNFFKTIPKLHVLWVITHNALGISRFNGAFAVLNYSINFHFRFCCQRLNFPIRYFRFSFNFTFKMESRPFNT